MGTVTVNRAVVSDTRPIMRPEIGIRAAYMAGNLADPDSGGQTAFRACVGSGGRKSQRPDDWTPNTRHEDRHSGLDVSPTGSPDPPEARHGTRRQEALSVRRKGWAHGET
jgi:hypothetical protein